MRTRNLPVNLKVFWDSAQFDPALSPTALLLGVAQACVGVKEEGGDNRGALVDLFETTTGDPLGVSWCLDYLQACIAYVELTKGFMSPLPTTGSVLDLWNHAKNYSAVSPPKPGDLILWRFGTTLTGHCGLITGMDSLRYQTVEGNTHDSTEIDRDGDGVYARSRAKGGSKTFVELGFLRCFQ